MRIVAEKGLDMKAFLSASAIVGWAGLKPRNEESAGKIKGRKILHGNKYLRILLVQCAWAACRTKGSRFFYKYHTLTNSMNHNKALFICKCQKNTSNHLEYIIKKQPFTTTYIAA